MNLKFWQILILLAIAIVAKSATCEAAFANPNHTDAVGDSINDEEEMMMDSETSRRVLAGKPRTISYAVLKASTTPCNKRGRSYYNCRVGTGANPYRRGCQVITGCYRFTY
ncbi:hypothetical protein MANES_14G142000v8 [Manihot esculenta]|uniref:Uncharacterized protein n=1 Tax=Manihot esculenta TaxID=3983 RepID=A0A2C9UNI7_MANES|nr:hypothetical protein MANES_14G142000v8 [Manihot esculenta]